MILGSAGRRPEIEYPCKWNYKVIGSELEKMVTVIEAAADGLEFELTPSNISKNGKYYSLNFSLVVPSEIVRDIVFQKLSDSEFIKYVL